MTLKGHTDGVLLPPPAGDYVNPDADAESVLADLEGVLSTLRNLSTACDTYKEYQVRALAVSLQQFCHC